MVWVFLEVLAALAIAFGIVWWTLPSKPRQPPGSAGTERKDDAGEAAKDKPPQG